jgi:hypothetical protein
MLQVGVDESGKEMDIVTQNQLSALQDTCGVFKWKLEMMSA